MVITDGGPAFPQQLPEGREGWLVEYGAGGMTLRDYFAAQALVALGDHKGVTQRGITWLAEHAYMVADAMLKAREGM